jgi:hypothetical protein
LIQVNSYNKGLDNSSLSVREALLQGCKKTMCFDDVFNNAKILGKLSFLVNPWQLMLAMKCKLFFMQSALREASFVNICVALLKQIQPEWP